MMIEMWLLKLFSMHNRNHRSAGQRRRSYHRQCISPDMPSCSPVDKEDIRSVDEHHHDLCSDNKRQTNLCSLYELLSSNLLVLFMSSPGSERRRLQGSAKGEGEDPGFGQRAVVDGIEVDRGLLFTLTAWEESHSCRGTVNTILTFHFYFYKFMRTRLKSYPWRLGEQCDVRRWWSPSQPPLGCTWWSSCVRQWPCWVWGECLPGRRGGRTWPCTLQPEPEDSFTNETDFCYFLSSLLIVVVTLSRKRHPPSQWCTGCVSDHDLHQAKSLALWWEQSHAVQDRRDHQNNI